MSGKKTFINKSKVKLKVRLLVRKGADPANRHHKPETFMLDSGESKVVTYGEESGDIYLNGIRLFWDDHGAECTLMQYVEKRGNWLDDLYNTNNTIVFGEVGRAKMSASNSNQPA